MFRIVLAEDEEWIRQGLKHYIQRLAGSFDIVGEAADGIEAKRLVEELKPDILITDIKMPGFTGLEVVRHAMQLNPDTACILVSGFKDFHLVQEAIQSGGMDYLLKPIQEDQLTAALYKAMARKQRNRLQTAYEPILSVEPLFQRLLEGDGEDSRTFAAVMEQSFPQLCTGTDKLVVVMDDDVPREKLQRIVMMSYNAIVLHPAARLYAIILPIPANSVIRGLESVMRGVIEHVRKECGVIAAAGFSTPFTQWEQLTGRYQEAYLTYAERFYYGHVWIGIPKLGVHHHSATTQENGDTNEAGKLAEQIVQQFELGRKDEACTNITQLFAMFVKLHVPMERVYTIITRMLRNIISVMDKHRLELLQLDAFQAYSWVVKRRTVAHLKQDTEELIVRMFGEFVSGSIHSAISRLQQIIEKEYQRPDLSIGELAERLHFNSSYLSELFKKKTGKPFTQYVMDMRLDKSKELLRQLQLRTYEVAYSVGYENEKAFSRAFKNKFGISPLEYRKSQHSLPET